MVVIFYGTSAELIKLLGITWLVPRSELFLICTAQHHEGLQKSHPQFGIEPDIYLSSGWRGKDVANMKQVFGMMLLAHGAFAKQFFSIKKKIKTHDKKMGTKSIAVVHGDTLSTVVGSYLGPMLGLKVAHVEAGLRSGSWKNPFPEEMDRRIAAKFARVHFAPNQTAVDNLTREHVKGEVINTTFNTAKDAIERSADFVSEEFKRLKLPKHYCLVLLHRTELLENKADLEAILKVINRHASARTPVVFTMHTTTQEKIDVYGFGHYLKKDGLHVIPKQPYFDFMAIVSRADYIVTDGGGLQEDAFFFGIPTMVHRLTTEREEGLGLNADISRMDVQKTADFLEHHRDKKDTPKQKSPAQRSVIQLYTRRVMQLRDERGRAVVALVAIGALTILSSADVLISKFWLSPEQAGQYAAVATIAKTILYATTPLMWLSLPLAVTNLPAANLKVKRFVGLTLAVAATLGAIFSIRPKLFTEGLLGIHAGSYTNLLRLSAVAMALFALAFILLGVDLCRDKLRQTTLAAVAAVVMFGAGLTFITDHSVIEKTILSQIIAAFTAIMISILGNARYGKNNPTH